MSYVNNNYYKNGSWNVICSSCSKEKCADEFYVHSNGKLRKQCKVCVQTRRNPIDIKNRNKYSKTYRDKNYELCLERTRKWRVSNKQYDAFRAATYRATKQQQTPAWANLNRIKELYLNCPSGYHVDHIVPLRGKDVCGFHVEYNLQYLTAKENLKKRNMYGVHE